MDFLDRIGLAHPVVQAGMGGGIAAAELGGAVSAAGALGTVAISSPSDFAAQLAGARERAEGRPIAANLIAPFARASHVGACVDAHVALVVFHGGDGAQWLGTLRDAGIPVLSTIGTVAQARDALAAGSDGLVVQGVEAGGHLMGDQPLAELLPRVRELGSFPLLAAGGIADSSDVAAVLAAGADAAIAGTRFLLTHESRAHPIYKQRVLDATRTVHTTLFSVGWPLAHRVIPNAVTERWARADGRPPMWVRQLERASGPLGRVLPLRAGDVMTRLQRAGLPLFGPAPPVAGMPDAVVDRSALYAGETAKRIDDVISAAEAVARLTISDASDPTFVRIR